jgi:hypothetical protein
MTSTYLVTLFVSIPKDIQFVPHLVCVVWRVVVV